MFLFIQTAIIIFLSSALQAATGFGFSILAIPLLLLIHSPLVAIKLNLILTIFLCLVMLREIRPHVDKKLLLRLIPCSVIGAPIGLAILLYVDNRTFELIIACLTLIFIVLLLLNLRFQRSRTGDFISGILAGGFTSAVGMGGIPLLLYFAGTNTSKATVRATAVAFFLFIYSATMLLQSMTTNNDFPSWWYAIGLAPISLAGILVGRYLYRKISQQAFSRVIYLILLANSLFLLIK